MKAVLAGRTLGLVSTSDWLYISAEDQQKAVLRDKTSSKTIRYGTMWKMHCAFYSTMGICQK